MGRFLTRIIKALLLLLVVLAAGLGLLVFLVIEDQPGVADYAPPSSQDVVAARGFVQEVKAALDPSNPATFIDTNEAQLNGAIKLGARLIPGFRGQVAVASGSLQGRVSLPVPYLRDKWLNLSARIPAFDGQLQLEEVALGPLPLPSSLTLETIRLAANQALGNRQGDRLLTVTEALRIKAPALRFAINQDTFGASGSNGLMRGLFGALRGGNPPEPEHIARYYKALRQAMDAGELPQSGSYLPYIHFTLAAARHEAAAGMEIAEAYTAALFALTLTCGAQDFTLVVGGLSEALDGVEDRWQRNCHNLTLNGRIDSRRQFTTAAAIQAASNRGVAVSIGEFKELYDSSKSGGFDFTDIAANNSGIRMSNKLMAAPLAEWPTLTARLTHESDVIIAYEGIPAIMSGAAFRQAYGNVDDARYQAMLGQIEAKIDGLALHQN